MLCGLKFLRRWLSGGVANWLADGGADKGLTPPCPSLPRVFVCVCVWRAQPCVVPAGWSVSGCRQPAAAMACSQYEPKFFSHVTSRVVLAAVEAEVGAAAVEEAVVLLTSWQAAALERHMTVRLLDSGRVSLQEGGLAVHHAARPAPGTAAPHVPITNEDVWSVFVVQGPALTVFAALNVGREGWCVLTAARHTLRHVLTAHGMAAENLDPRDDEEACGAACGETRWHALVPRARAGLRQYPTSQRPRSLRWHMYLVRRMRQLCWMMLAESEQAMVLCEAPLYHYLIQGDPEPGWVLVAGFDVRARVHRAAGRTGTAEPPVEVVCPEGEERGFLARVGPLLRRCCPSTRNSFLRQFTQINPLCWDEAAEVVDGEGGLRAAAYRHVCSLPLPYLAQHAPPSLYLAISRSRSLVPWASEEDLKGPEE